MAGWAAAAAAPLGAQPVLGAGPSAFVVPRGVVRFGLTQDWGSYGDTFGAAGDSGSARRALGARLSADAFGPRQLAVLVPVERDLRQLADQSGLSVSLGRTLVTSTVSTRTTTVDLEAGLGGGISFTVAVPVVRTAAAVGLETNASGSEANVGLNPARFGSGDVARAAAARNALVKTQFDTAAQRLRQQYATCFTASGAPSGAAGCADVVSLYQSATSYAAALARVYGVAAQGGAAVIPIASSAAQRAVNAAVRGYNARFAALFGGAGAAAVIRDTLQGALPLSVDDVQTLLTRSAGGVGVDSLRGRTRLTLGDVEVGLRLRFIDTFGKREARRFVPRGVNLRSTVAGTFRVGTGHVDAPNDLLDVGTGDGQNDIEVASLTDVLFGPRAWVSLAARYGRQLADEQELRVPPAAGGGAYLPAYTLQRVGRDLGDYVQIEATPRVALGTAFAVEARYSYRRQQADRYTGTFPVADPLGGSAGLVLDAGALDDRVERREQRVGGGVTYSTYAAYARGRARLPLELSLSYLRAVTGQGGVPALGVTQLQLRAFPRLFGRDWRAPAAARP